MPNYGLVVFVSAHRFRGTDNSFFMLNRIFIFLIAIALSTPSLAQTPNLNQAAVDTLTKDVATVVLANQRGDKAGEILNQLTLCAGSCDVVAIIRSVGGWDAVGVKMQELGQLKNTAQFQAMLPGDANAAIRRELARFYAKYKTDKNYGVPLNPEVQAQMLVRIDRMLPPAVAPAPTVAAQPADGQADKTAGPNENANVDSDAYRMGRLERKLKEEGENRIWMMILSAIVGLIVGAGVVYLLLYRSLKKEADRLTDDNTRLSRDLDAARRAKIANEPRQPQPENRRRPDTYTPPAPEPGLDRQVRAAGPVDLKPPVADSLTTPPVIRSGTPVPGTPDPNEPVAESMVASEIAAPIQSQTQSTAPVSTPSPARSEVFYFPPPDPNGQFGNAQRADMLLPESAYRFSTSAEKPDVATFRFEAEPGRVARFLTYRNYMIEPACDSENSYSSTYTRVVNRRDGEAVLENGVWRVKTKALIRYE